MARETGIVKIEDILSRLRAGDKIKTICRESGAHRSVVRRVARAAAANGWQQPDAPLPTGLQLRDAYFGASASRQPHPLDSFRDDCQRWIDDKLTYDAMWRRICVRHPCSETQVRRYVQNSFPRAMRVVVRRDTPFAVMEVDFGYLGLTLDPQTGFVRKTWIFSGRLRYARKSYRELVYRQDQEIFFDCHVRAFKYFGGVPESVVPDNLKSAIVKASFVEPLPNLAYHELAKHYNFKINPCNPYSPEHKGGVESDIRYIKSSFWRPFLSDQRAMGRDAPVRTDTEAALLTWQRSIADVRNIQGTGRSVNELFAEESPALRILPITDWEMVRWERRKVQRSQLVRVEKCWYSVPERCLGREVEVKISSRQICLYHANELIASHCRPSRAEQEVWIESHRGVAHRQYQNWNRDCLERRASAISPVVAQMVQNLLDRSQMNGMRPANGLLGLAKKYTPERLSAACARAQYYELIGYGHVKTILEKELDKLAIDNATDVQGQPRFTFARPPEFFDTTPPQGGES